MQPVFRIRNSPTQVVNNIFLIKKLVITEFLMVISLQNQFHSHEFLTFNILFTRQTRTKSDTKISKYNIILCNGRRGIEPKTGLNPFLKTALNILCIHRRL